MFTSGTEILKKAENVSMICNAPDDHRLQLMTTILTIRELVDMVGISFASVQTILKDHLCLRRVKSHLVPKFLNFFEKERRVQACEAMFSDYQGVYKQIITGDWIYAYDPETTDTSSECRLKGEAKPKRPRQSRSKMKVMLTVFFDYRDVVFVHYEFLPTGQTVNKEYYLSVMRHFPEAIRKNRPELWANNSWICTTIMHSGTLP